MAKYYYQNRQPKVLQAHIDWARSDQWDIEFSPNFQPDISRDRAQKIMLKFWSDMSCKVYGRMRNGLPKNVIKRRCYIEGDGINQQVHYHCAVQLPAPREPETLIERAHRTPKFCERLLREWNALPAAGYFTSCTPIKSFEGFTVYICKKALSDSFCGLTTEL